MSRSLLVLGLLLWLGSVQAHICLISPRQRGPFNVSNPGDDSCYRRTDYCGKYQLAPPLTTYVAGQTTTITLQQNLNHFFPGNPGFFDISVSYNLQDPVDSDWIVISSWPDAPAFDMVTQTTMDITVTFPAKASPHVLLRARYYSNNPMEIDPPSNTDAIFYNCADIVLVAEALPQPPQPAPSSVASDFQCRTPLSWFGQATETNEYGFVLHTIFWDVANMRTRWDRVGNLDGPAKTTIVAINDYTKPVEWVNFVDRGKCFAFGNDAFFPWAYGVSTNMQYQGTLSNGIDLWKMNGGAGPYSWQTRMINKTTSECAPVAWTRGRSTFVVDSFTVGPINPTVFQPAPECTHKVEFAGCHAKEMAAKFAHQHL